MLIATDGKDIYDIPEKGSVHLRIVTKATPRLPRYCFNAATKALFRVSVKRSEIILIPASYEPAVLDYFLEAQKPVMKSQALSFLTDAFPDAPEAEVTSAVEKYCALNHIV